MYKAIPEILVPDYLAFIQNINVIYIVGPVTLVYLPPF